MFLELVELVIFSLITLISMVIILVLGLIYVKKSYFFEDLFEDILKNIASDPKMQESIFQIGGLFASGIKAGIGSTAPTGPKNLKQLGMQLLADWIGGKIQIPANIIPSPSPAPSTSSQNSQERVINKKW